VPERDLPGIDVVAWSGTDDDPAGSAWRVESWRAHPAAAVAAVVVLLAGGVAAVAVRRGGNEYSGPDALREWASDQHGDLDPPAGVVLPDVTCDGDPYDLLAVRTCLRRAQRTGTPAIGHMRADMGYPDAFDHWTTVDADGQATMIERQLTVTHRPDVQGTGKIRPWELETTTVSWRTWECDRVRIFDEVDQYPGVECEVPPDEPTPQPASHDVQVRKLSEAERQDLVRAFACAHPAELSEYGC